MAQPVGTGETGEGREEKIDPWGLDGGDIGDLSGN